MKKIEICNFDTTPEQLEKEGRIFIPHKGYTFKPPLTKKEKLWIDLKRAQRVT
jgi:hypothetical protein